MRNEVLEKLNARGLRNKIKREIFLRGINDRESQRNIITNVLKGHGRRRMRRRKKKKKKKALALTLKLCT